MSVNKVIYNAKILIDLTSDSVSADTLLKGITAHDKSGNVITGTFEGGTYEDGDNLVYGEEAIGYNISFTSVRPYQIIESEGYAFYSLDNGATWNDFYNLYNDGLYTNPVLQDVTSIKFKVKADGNYESQIKSPILNLDISANVNNMIDQIVSENYILNADVDDLEVYVDYM